MVGQLDAGNLARVGVRDDFHHVPGRHGDEAVHLQDGQECLVERRRRHRRRGQHGDLRAYPRIDDEGLTSRRAHRLGNLRDIRVLEVRSNALRLLLG